MSNLLVAPIEENAAKLKANKKPKPKEGWLDDLITEKAMKSLKLPTKAKKTTTVEKPGVGHNGKLTQNAMVKMLEEEESREAKIDHKKRIGDRHEQVGVVILDQNQSDGCRQSGLMIWNWESH